MYNLPAKWDEYNSGGRGGHLLIGRKVGGLIPACLSILGKDSEPQVAL